MIIPEIDKEWFIASFLTDIGGYNITRSFFSEGDFGNLDRFELDNSNITASVEFWSEGWLAICVFDYIKNDLIQNEFIEPHQLNEKVEVFKRLKKILISPSRYPLGTNRLFITLILLVCTRIFAFPFL